MRYFVLLFASALLTLCPPVARATPASATPYRLVVSDYTNNRVDAIDSTTLAVAPFVSAGSGGLNGPAGLSIARDGSLLVSSGWTNDVRRFDARTGASLGTFATDAQVPIFSKTGRDGDLYVASRDGRGVLVYNGVTGQKKRLITPPNNDNSLLWWAFDVDFLPDGDLIVSSFERGSILRFDGATGALEGLFSPASDGYAAGMAWGPDGNLYLARYGTNRIDRVRASDGVVLGSFASGNGLYRPVDLTFAPDGRLFVANERSNVISIFDGTTGAAAGQIVGPNLSNEGYSSIAVLPEPTTALAGASLLAGRRRRRRR